MSGVDVIGLLLRGAVSITAVVPEARIKAGKLPDNVALPALLVRSVSLNERQMLKRGETVRTIERIAVTVRAASYIEQDAIIRLVRNCCAGRTGDIGDVQRVSVLSAGTGPDVIGPGNSFEKTQDFRVSFDAAASTTGDHHEHPEETLRDARF